MIDSDILIREARPGDIDEIVELCRCHALYEGVKYDIRGKKNALNLHLFAGTMHTKCLLVVKGMEILGYATMMRQFSTWDVAFYVYMDCLYLKEEVRGRGIGSKLMRHVRNYALNEGCNVIEWQTPNDNLSAILFYNALGAKALSKERFTWHLLTESGFII